MNKDLKFGDKVMLSEDTGGGLWTCRENNPTYTVGTVDGFDSEGWVGVDWGGIYNEYSLEGSDLIKLGASMNLNTKQIKKDALDRLATVRGIIERMGTSRIYVGGDISDIDWYLGREGYIEVSTASHEYSISITEKGYKALESEVDITEYKQDKVYKTEFKIGDRVYLRAGFVLRFLDSNPLGVIGTVVDELLDTHSTPTLLVKWGTRVQYYRNKDLMSEEEYLDRYPTSIELSIAPVGYTFESPKVAKEQEAYANKIIIKYVTGESYTIRGATAVSVDWVGLSLGWRCEYNGGTWYDTLNDDVLCVESWEKDSLLAFFNPKYKKSAKLDVMTARQRCKKNNGDGYEGTPRLSGGRLFGIDIEKAFIGTSLRCHSHDDDVESWGKLLESEVTLHSIKAIKGNTVSLPRMTKEDLRGTFYLATPEQSAELQKIFFKFGIDWKDANFGEVSHVMESYLSVDENYKLAYRTDYPNGEYVIPADTIIQWFNSENTLPKVTREELLGKYYEVTPKQSVDLQELCFKLGIEWCRLYEDSGSPYEINYTDRPYLYVSNSGRLYYSYEATNTIPAVKTCEVDELLKRGA